MEKNLLLAQFRAITEDITEEISLLSNASACMMQLLEDISWVGFYLYKHDNLILGPFQGKVACTNIAMNKGVCGTSAYKQETLVVEDVHKFPGHIACDSASNSEIVVPIIVNDTLYGVLDVDSTSFARFKEDEKELFEGFVEILVNQLEQL
ncbi:GAF domain-containing protein [Breznakia blatticola]|uniref:GAF domain-containing protein n=1 Tax=Breznakia blatticola TaxID=1754012 RepID=A0A4V3G919_9FIRM|nr:GAF domain-containing protein [Breznakia blatticola]TDW25104.1 GAF domain-containing protein [Breznakia blatticola]